MSWSTHPTARGCLARCPGELAESGGIVVVVCPPRYPPMERPGLSGYGSKARSGGKVACSAACRRSGPRRPLSGQRHDRLIAEGT